MERLLSRRCLGKECADRRERTGESGGELKTEERKVGERTARKTKKKEEGREQEKRKGGAEGD